MGENGCHGLTILLWSMSKLVRMMTVPVLSIDYSGCEHKPDLRFFINFLKDFYNKFLRNLKIINYYTKNLYYAYGIVL